MRAAVLLLVDETARNGYQIIQELEERSGGLWRPSPGSIYPILQQLEDEGLVTQVPGDSGRTFTVTDAGRAYVEQNRESFGQPWETVARGVGGPDKDLMGVARQVAMAVHQVLSAGTEAQKSQAATVMADTRRALYKILADDEPTEQS